MKILKTYEEFDPIVGIAIPALIGFGLVRTFNLIKTLMKSKKMEKSAIDSINKIINIDKTEPRGKMLVIKGPSTINIISDKRQIIYGGTIFSFQINTENNVVYVDIRRKGIYNLHKEFSFNISEEEKELILNIIKANVINI